MPPRAPAFSRPLPQQYTATNRPIIRPTLAPAPAPAASPFTPVAPQMKPQLPSNPNALVWDAEQKEVNATTGQVNVPFTFYFTNVSSSEVIINSVRTSCGCTTAKLPPMPWHLPAGTNASLEVNMNIAGKFGTVLKSVTVDSTSGIKNLMVKVNVPTAPQPAPGVPVPTAGIPAKRVMETEADRVRNQQMALVDRQAVFKGDCVTCHVTPGIGKMGAELFTAVCGVCHEAEHRASMVPDLKNLPHATDADHWRGWINFGRVGSLMPAFAKSEGGPLTEQQVASLVDYLVRSHPTKPGAPKSDKSASAPVAK